MQGGCTKKQKGAAKYVKNKQKTESKEEAERRRKKRVIVVTFLATGIFLIAAMGIGRHVSVALQKITVSINGESVELETGVTYGELYDEGYLVAKPGDLLAIDGSVLEVGGGGAPTVYSDGILITDYSKTLESKVVITELRGADIVEPFELVDHVIPMSYHVESGENFQFYGNTLHMPLAWGSDGLEQTRVGSLSGIVLPRSMGCEMVPTVYGSYHPWFGQDQKVVALTYDDGPHPVYTQEMLEVLAKYNVKATFFMLGTSVESYPEIAVNVRDAGHQIASHSYSHAAPNYLNALDSSGVAYQVSTAQAVIYNATGVETRVLRPPGGNLNAQAVIAGAPCVDAYVGWDIGTGDYTLPGAEAIYDKVMNKVHPGSIVLMHDGGGNRAQTVEATDLMIKALLAQGYSFVTIDELIELTKASIPG